MLNCIRLGMGLRWWEIDKMQLVPVAIPGAGALAGALCNGHQGCPPFARAAHSGMRALRGSPAPAGGFSDSGCLRVRNKPLVELQLRLCPQ